MNLRRLALNLLVFMTCLVLGMLAAQYIGSRLVGSAAQQLQGGSSMPNAAAWTPAAVLDESPRGADGEELALETASFALG